MSRWVTFIYDYASYPCISHLVVHPNRKSAYKYFVKNYKNYFPVNFEFKPKDLPAWYGFPSRRFIGESAFAFMKRVGMDVDSYIKVYGRQ